MIKDELIHSHQFLDEFVTYLEDEFDITIDLDEYEDTETGPYSFFHNKSKHEDAVKALSSDVLEELEDVSPEQLEEPFAAE